LFALLFVIKTVKRAFELGEPLRDEVKIYDCGFYGGVTEESQSNIFLAK